VLVAAAGCAGGDPAVEPPPLDFEDMTTRLDPALARLRDGVVFLDADDDGRTDIYAPDHGRAPRMCIAAGAATLRCEPASAWGIQPGDLHGAAAADLDGDGRVDLVQTVGGGRGFGKVGSLFDRLYAHATTRRFEDVGSTRFPPDPHGRGRAVRVLDYDRDGRVDVLVANARARTGESRNRLYHHEADGRFVDRAAALGVAFPSTAPLIHDLDGDGYPDLLARRRIHWNESGTAFTAAPLDVVATAPPAAPGTSAAPGTRAASGALTLARPVFVVADVDNDARLDIVALPGTAGDRRDAWVIDGAGILWIDLTAPRNRLDDDRLVISTASPDLEIVRLTHRNSTREEIGAGLDHRRVYLGPAKTHPRPYGYDLAGDGPAAMGSIELGTPDLADEGLYLFRTAATQWTLVARGNRRARRRGRFLVGLRSPGGFTRVEAHGLEDAGSARQGASSMPVYLRNLGGRRFALHPITIGGGATVGEIAAAACGDFDNDGRIDLVVLAAPQPGAALHDVVLWNAGGGSFLTHPLPTTPSLGSDRAAHVWDMDGDGRLDLLLTSDLEGSYVVLRNVSANGNRWLAIALEGDGPTARYPVGVRIELEGAWGRQVREVGQIVRLNMSVVPLHFGLGAAGTVDAVRVHWRSGSVDLAGSTLAPDRRHVLQERPDSAHDRGD
jgi:hypothetical protein